MANPDNPNTRPQLQQNADIEVDAIGLKCPLPLLKMKQALNKAEAGQVVFVRATDPGSQRDFKAYIDMTTHHLNMSKDQDIFLYWVTKAEQNN